ncbi:hypothetical protein P20311_2264 [Pseudoalteromonas sp. BSi20311]|nr:hypothetical protein P20311_2264 [Pseudoalteromonas sp. BSi20311]
MLTLSGLVDNMQLSHFLFILPFNLLKKSWREHKKRFYLL